METQTANLEIIELGCWHISGTSDLATGYQAIRKLYQCFTNIFNEVDSVNLRVNGRLLTVSLKPGTESLI